MFLFHLYLRYIFSFSQTNLMPDTTLMLLIPKTWSYCQMKKKKTQYCSRNRIRVASIPYKLTTTFVQHLIGQQ